MNDLVVLTLDPPWGQGVAVVACRDKPWGPLTQWLEAQGITHPHRWAQRFKVQELYSNCTTLNGAVVVHGDLPTIRGH
mgnify:FL=1